MDKCVYTIEGGQFCGGTWYQPECCNEILWEIPAVCPFCHKEVILEDE